eukprot:1847451-Ditylum_brightwellii.AAC.1
MGIHNTDEASQTSSMTDTSKMSKSEGKRHALECLFIDYPDNQDSIEKLYANGHTADNSKFFLDMELELSSTTQWIEGHWNAQYPAAHTISDAIPTSHSTSHQDTQQQNLKTLMIMLPNNLVCTHADYAPTQY